MAHRRIATAERLPEGDALTSACAGIGILFAATPLSDANIEDTLVAASVAGMDQDDLRVLAVLVTWLGVHHAWINADRLTRAVGTQTSPRVRAFWAAVAVWLKADRRFRKLETAYGGPRVELLATGTAFQVKRHGEDARFSAAPLLVPANVLRDRGADVLAPSELARRHGAYRWRVIIGPSYRADMWAALEAEPGLSAAELARRAYGSFATAWQVKRDAAVVAVAATPRPNRLTGRQLM